jgi:DNA-binding MarR family transcriptional regulator
VKIDDEIKSKFDSNIQKAMVNIIYTHNFFWQSQVTMLKKHAIQPQHYNVLRIIKGKHPNPVSPGEIKKVMLDKGADVTRLLDKLEKMGAVKRKLCDSNRRMMDVNITDKGIKLLAAIAPEIKKNASVQLKNISEQEAQKLSDLLDKIRG